MLRGSLRFDEDEDGVSVGEAVAGSRELTGDAVPSLESLFFLDDLLGSLPRESCQSESLATAFPGKTTLQIAEDLEESCY